MMQELRNPWNWINLGYMCIGAYLAEIGQMKIVLAIGALLLWQNILERKQREKREKEASGERVRD